MDKILVALHSNWADEMDIYGLGTMDEDWYNKLNDGTLDGERVTHYFGTNEDGYVSTHDIRKIEYDALAPEIIDIVGKVAEKSGVDYALNSVLENLWERYEELKEQEALSRVSKDEFFQEFDEKLSEMTDDQWDDLHKAVQLFADSVMQEYMYAKRQRDSSVPHEPRKTGFYYCRCDLCNELREKVYTDNRQARGYLLSLVHEIKLHEVFGWQNHYDSLDDERIARYMFEWRKG